MFKYKKILGKFLISIISGLLIFPVNQVYAASVTSFSDTMSRLKDSTASNHQIKFVTPTGVTAGQTIILTFSGFATVTNIVFSDIDFAEGDSNNCTTANFTEKTLAAAPSGATWGADGDSATTVTLTSSTGTVTANRCVRIRIGTNAVNQTTGVNQITNGTAATNHTIAVGGAFADSGILNVDVITDDQVSVTATVDPTLTFSISDNSIGFGSLSSAAARWADGAGTGSASDTSAHSMTVATNAPSGYVLNYNGATLTSGGNIISVASITDDADGTIGSEQFGMGFAVSNGSTVATGYDHNATPGNRDWTFVAGTATDIVSRTTPTNTETISAYYLANIGGATEAGSYATTITYITTGSF